MKNSDDECTCAVQAHSVWLYIVPSGMYGVVNYLKEKYQNPTIIISENGNTK